MIKNLTKTLVVVVSSTIISTLGVHAVDMRDHYVNPLLEGLALSTQKIERICPEGMVRVTQTLIPFCIDKYEVSTGEACTYRTPENNDETILNLSNKKCIPKSVPQRMPWRNITIEQAQTACAQTGKRLPTPNEWFIAGFGTPDQNSGWTDEQCNVANNRADGVSVSGSGMRCVSNVGAYDMIGNVWEWVEGTVEYGVYQDAVFPQTGFVTEVSLNGLVYTTSSAKNENYFHDRFWLDSTIEAGIMRGGYFNNQDQAGLYATYAASPVTFSGDAVGFRCVAPLGN